MTKEEAKAEIRKVFEPAFANYIITALTEGATPSERKTGKWKTSSDFPDRLICSECSAQFDMWHWEAEQMHYCPKCGAKMEGAEE